MLSPLHPPSTDAHLFASGPSTDHVPPQNDIRATTGHQRNGDNVIGWPWCQSCRPFVQILLAQGVASIAGQGGPSAPWAFSSPFPDYVFIPALVHRSQLVLPTASAIPPASPTLSPQEQTDPSSIHTTQRKTRGVKIACTNCRSANKRCDEGRPCERCIKNGLEHSCHSAERKQRRRTVRQTATARLTLSATQVSVETPAATEDDSMTTTVHIAAGTSYVDDTAQEITDVASHSSPSGSSMTAPEIDNQCPDIAFASNYAMHATANFWAHLAHLPSFPTASADHQFPTWSFDDRGHEHMSFFGHNMSPTASDDHHGLSPTGLEGSGAFQSADQHF